MQESSPSRCGRRLKQTGRAFVRYALRCALLVLLLPLALFAASQQRPAVVQPRSPASQPARPAAKQPGGGQGGRNQEHLAEWMNRHRDLPVQQQQRALESEPGFKEYPAQTQQRLRDRLTELNNMRPAQRERILEHNEVMEHLSAPQRQQVRGAMLQLSSLPEDRRHAVARAFRDLRTMPEADRQQYLNSPAFKSQYNEQERGTLNNLMAVEPYLPGKRPGETPPQ